jgi:hypothetical protein
MQFCWYFFMLMIICIYNIRQTVSYRIQKANILLPSVDDKLKYKGWLFERGHEATLIFAQNGCHLAS